MTSWAPVDDVDKAKADSWLDTAKTSTEQWLSSFGYGNGPKALAVPEPPAMDIKLPTAEEWHAAAPWRDLDPPKQQLPSTSSGTPAGMPSNTPQTGNINSSTITQGPTGPALQPGESVGSVTLAGGSNPEGQASVYRAARAAGRSDEDARILAAVTETEGGWGGAVGDNGQSHGIYQFHNRGEMPAFRAWLQQQGIQGDPNALSYDPDIATRFAATTYLGSVLDEGRKQGLSGADLATYVQAHGQVSENPERTGANYARLYGPGSRNAGAVAAPPAPAPASAPAAAPPQQPSSTAGADPDTVDVISPEGTRIPGVPRTMVGEGPGKYAPSKGWRIADPRQALNAGSAVVSEPAAPPPAAPGVPSAGSGPDNAMWSPDGSAAPQAAYQMGAGRNAGGIMQRASLADENGEYAPRQADEGAHEATQSTYNDPTSEGTINAPINYPSSSATSVEQPDSGPTSGNPSNNIVLQDGRTAPPTPSGQWEPVTNLTQPPSQQPAQDPGEWLANDSQSQAPAQASEPPQAPSGMKTVWDAAGNVLGYVKDAAESAASTVANEGIVRPIARPISNTIRAAQGREPLTADTEPVPTLDRAVMETARSLGENTAAAQEGYQSGNPLQAGMGALGVLGDLAPTMFLSRQLNEMLPKADTPLGEIGVGDVVMTAALVHDAARLGYGAIKAGQRTWAKIAQAVQEGVPAEEFGTWLHAGETGRAAGAADDVIASPAPHVYSPTPPEGVNRRYHGTAGAFDSADPTRFDENGLYGPGYYTTSDPRVAGSYSTSRGRPFISGHATGQQLMEDIAWTERQLALPALSESDRGWLEARLPLLKRDLERTPAEGPNVRPIDVPKNLNMIDADAPLQQETIARVQAVVDSLARKSPEVADEINGELMYVAGDLKRRAGNPDQAPLTNDSLITSLMSGAERAIYRGDGTQGGKGLMTEILERAGFDGINHKGGQRVPMMDSAGQPIEHDVSVIFPGSVKKVKNALSGTEGGGYIPFDPSSAAIGAGAGAETDEDGNPTVDPLKAAAGMAIGAVTGTPQGKRLVLRAARGAKQAAPPNLLEIMQAFRFSWGMLGNFAGGAVNASGGPIEMALGIPSEAFRMGVLHQRPAAAVYSTAELLGGLKQGVRDMLGTIIGQVPAAVRNSPDFRPPMNERMPGLTGSIVGHAIEAPGRLATQVPDALWSPPFYRQGRAIEAGNIMAENGVSRLRPDRQYQEMHRLLNNPTPEEAKRIEEAAKAWQEEMQYKGKAGYIEGQINNLVRGSSGKVATANDPIEKQVHEALGSFAMPFFGTLWKQYKLAASRVPVVNFVTNRSLPTDQKISRSVVGAALGMYLVDRAASGLITGPGPSDPDEAALVNKDMPPLHSYVPGIGWVPNSYFGSAAPYLNAVGGYYDARRYASDKAKSNADTMGDETAKSMLKAFASFPIAQAVQNFITMAESPTKGVTDAAAGTASSFIPAPVKTYLGSQDTKVRTTDREAGFVDQLTQKTEARTGIGRQSLPVAQDRFGRDVENPRQGAAAFGLNIKQPQNDPVVALFRENDVQPGMPKKDVSIPDASGVPPLPMTPARQRAWNQARGAKLMEMAQSKMNDPEFQAKPPDKKKAQLELLLKLAGEYADGVVLREMGPDERKRLIQEQKKAS